MNRIVGQQGATLIEMVISIVIISVTVTALMMVISQVARSSSDPMIRVQATSIARAYMDEILMQALNDPDVAETGGPEVGETRATYDDVSDYHGLADTAGAVDQTGSAIVGLEGYNISVSVAATTLGGYSAKRIRVDVGFDGDANFSLPLTSYRLN
jgi:MSHA pilin protein MshD